MFSTENPTRFSPRHSRPNTVRYWWKIMWLYLAAWVRKNSEEPWTKMAFCPTLFAPKTHKLDGGFRYFLFSPLFREDSHFDQYFSKGLKPPPSKNLVVGGCFVWVVESFCRSSVKHFVWNLRSTPLTTMRVSQRRWQRFQGSKSSGSKVWVVFVLQKLFQTKLGLKWISLSSTLMGI